MASAASKVVGTLTRVPKSMLGRVGDKTGNAVTKISTVYKEKGLPRLKVFWFYAKVELAPPGIKDMPEIMDRFGKSVQTLWTGKWFQMPVKEAAVNVCVGAEIFCCFFLGEMIGRRSIVGYSRIPDNVHMAPMF